MPWSGEKNKELLNRKKKAFPFAVYYFLEKVHFLPGGYLLEVALFVENIILFPTVAMSLLL